MSCMKGNEDKQVIHRFLKETYIFYESQSWHLKKYSFNVINELWLVSDFLLNYPSLRGHTREFISI